MNKIVSALFIIAMGCLVVANSLGTNESELKSEEGRKELEECKKRIEAGIPTIEVPEEYKRIVKNIRQIDMRIFATAHLTFFFGETGMFKPSEHLKDFTDDEKRELRKKAVEFQEKSAAMLAGSGCSEKALYKWTNIDTNYAYYISDNGKLLDDFNGYVAMTATLIKGLQS